MLGHRPNKECFTSSHTSVAPGIAPGETGPQEVSRAVIKVVTGGWSSGWQAVSDGYKAVGGPLGGDGSGWQG